MCMISVSAIYRYFSKPHVKAAGFYVISMSQFMVSAADTSLTCEWASSLFFFPSRKHQHNLKPPILVSKLLICHFTQNNNSQQRDKITQEDRN